MLDCIIERTDKYIDRMTKKERKKYGQFFTSKETARFMTGLYDIPEGKSKISILDAGSGSGILSCAFLERLEQIAFVQTIELTCYENDANILGLFNLDSDGEMVYIIPRSWTSGAYFKCFRQYFLTEGKLEHIHLFVSRNKVFDKEDVL